MTAVYPANNTGAVVQQPTAASMQQGGGNTATQMQMQQMQMQQMQMQQMQMQQSQMQQMQMQQMMAGIMFPSAPKWAPSAPSRSGCPPGLEALADLDRVKIIEDVNQADLISPISLPNRYSVRNMNDEQIYFAGEAASPMQASPWRQIDLSLVDSGNKACMTLRRLRKDMGCCTTCCPYCVMAYPYCFEGSFSKMEVRGGDGRTLGMTRHVYDCCNGRIQIDNESNSTSFEAVADCCGNFGNINTLFSLNYNGSRIGEIQRLYGGMRTQMFQADSFMVAFPKDLDVVSKALVVATGILIDYVYFENKSYRQQYVRRTVYYR